MPVGPEPSPTLRPITGEAFVAKAFVVDASGKLYLTKGTMGFYLPDWPTILVQADATFTVDFRLMDDSPWGPYPGDSAGAANDILLFRGRWDALRVTAATGTNVYVRLDRLPLAWS